MRDKYLEERKLIHWVWNQKKLYNKGKLNVKKILLLEQIKQWDWDIVLTKWLKNYNKLKTYLEKYNKYPKKDSQNNNERKLEQWCRVQRAAFKGRHYKINKEQIKLLEKLIGWKWGYEKDEKWINKYNKLKQWIKKYKKYPSVFTKNKQEKTLAYWCSDQRQRRKDNKLSIKRIKLLDQLAYWYWDVFKNKWYQVYLQLKKYINLNKKYPSRHSLNKKEQKLGSWVAIQRSIHNNKLNYNSLNKYNIKLLERLPGWKW
jgi:hypothetical protein